MRSPNLLRKVRIGEALRMLPVAKKLDGGGKPYFDLTHVLLARKPVVASAGTFYLEYYEHGRRTRRAIGEDPRVVKAALATQASVLEVRARGGAADDAPQLRPRMAPEGKTIKAVVKDFRDHPPLEYRRTSYTKYRHALDTFEKWVRKTHVTQLDRDDIRDFMTALVRQQKLDVSTAKDKARIVLKVMLDNGGTIKMRKGDWPKVTEQQPEIYKADVLKKLFAAARPEEYVLFQTFLLSGMRDQEVAHLAWEDFDPALSTLRVRKKPGFDPKTYEERTVPIFPELVELLLAHRKGREREFYIFATSKKNARQGAPGGQADNHMLDKLKALARRAGLNCGRCVGSLRKKKRSCADAAVCGEFGLHKFRHTYATTMLQDGVDLKSLQKLLGHKNLESTEKYLRALEPEDLLAKIRKTSLATKFV